MSDTVAFNEAVKKVKNALKRRSKDDWELANQLVELYRYDEWRSDAIDEGERLSFVTFFNWLSLREEMYIDATDMQRFILIMRVFYQWGAFAEANPTIRGIITKRNWSKAHQFVGTFKEGALTHENALEVIKAIDEANAKTAKAEVMAKFPELFTTRAKATDGKKTYKAASNDTALAIHEIEASNGLLTADGKTLFVPRSSSEDEDTERLIFTLFSHLIANKVGVSRDELFLKMVNNFVETTVKQEAPQVIETLRVVWDSTQIGKEEAKPFPLANVG